MFDIGASELLLIVIVAVVVIGPKDLPLALRTAGRWMGKIRRVSGHFRSGIETMIREAELEDMEKKWREQNAAIIAASAEAPPTAAPLVVADDHLPRPADESQLRSSSPAAERQRADEPAEPSLPLYEPRR